MGGPRRPHRRGDAGGIAEAAPEFGELVNAVRMKMDWRTLAGLTEDDRGTLVERVLARAVLGAAIEAHNRDMSRLK